jgi:predicted nucleotidyltransferase
MRESKEIRQRLVEWLARSGPGEGIAAAWLFGSHAAGRAHHESDVDVALLLDWSRYPDRGTRSCARVRLGSDLIAALHHDDVQVVVLNDAPPLFARRIVVEGDRLHVGSPEVEHGFRRDVQLRAADVAPFVERARRRLLETVKGKVR